MTDPTFDRLLIHRFTILRATTSPDGVGGPGIETWDTVSGMGTVTGLVRPTPLAQSTIAKLVIDCHMDVDVVDEDRVLNVRLANGTAHPLYGNKVYHVLSAVDAAGQGHHIVLNLTELSGGN